MKQEIVTQYLALKLKVSQMITRLQEQEGTITELNREILRLEASLTLKSEELMEARNQAKELEKNFKKSDNFAKIVASTDNTAVPTAELKEKLEEYITKIDHCIDQLRNP